MQYPGSKRRFAKSILEVIGERPSWDIPWVEPFVGGANMIDKVHGCRMGYDSNPYLIAMWNALREGWDPPQFLSKEEYYEVKNNQESAPPELVAFVGFACSFGSKWFGGYAKNNSGTNYCGQGRNVVLKQAALLQGVSFECLPFEEVAHTISDGSYVYCDPPYASTTNGYLHPPIDGFWDIVRELSKRCPVWVSEYSAPPDFECVWMQHTYTVMDLNNSVPRVERLFKERPE